MTYEGDFYLKQGNETMDIEVWPIYSARRFVNDMLQIGVMESEEGCRDTRPWHGVRTLKCINFLWQAWIKICVWKWAFPFCSNMVLFDVKFALQVISFISYVIQKLFPSTSLTAWDKTIMIFARDKSSANKSSKKSMTQGTGGISNGEMMVRWLDSDEKIFDLLQGCGAAVSSLASITILRSLIFLFNFWWLQRVILSNH